MQCMLYNIETDKGGEWNGANPGKTFYIEILTVSTLLVMCV